MKKIVITILALLFIPAMAGAVVDELTLQGGHNIEVNGMTFIVTGLVDDMVIDTTTATFTLSTDSTVTIKSNDRYTLPVSLSGSDLSCGTSYSQKTITGSQGSSLVFTPDGTVCTGTVGGGADPVTSSPGGGAAVTPPPVTPTTPTTTTGAVTATSGGGGETTLTTDESTTAGVSLPIGAVTASTNIIVTTESQATVTGSRPAPSSRSIVGGYVYDFSATSGGEDVNTFQETATLTFTYTDEQISGLNESNLRVFYWKESTSQWVALVTTVNAETNTITAETDHFTYFAIMGLPEGETEDEEEIIEETTTIIDGDLIRNPNAEGMAQFDIYIVKLVGDKKFKRLILSPHVFESYEHFDKNGNGNPWDDVVDVAQSVMDEQTTSDLVRAVGDSKVYRLTASGDTGTKRWMNMTATQFRAQGSDSDSIYEINATDRNAYTAGVDVTVE